MVVEESRLGIGDLRETDFNLLLLSSLCLSVNCSNATWCEMSWVFKCGEIMPQCERLKRFGIVKFNHMTLCTARWVAKQCPVDHSIIFQKPQLEIIFFYLVCNSVKLFTQSGIRCEMSCGAGTPISSD